jgi:hypothetical protein
VLCKVRCTSCCKAVHMEAAMNSQEQAAAKQHPAPRNCAVVHEAVTFTTACAALQTQTNVPGHHACFPQAVA